MNTDVTAGLPDSDEKSSRPTSRSQDSYAQLATTLWRYRLPLAVAAAAALLFSAVLYMTQPRKDFSTLKFRLLFDGSETGTYPSGVRFSPSDIVSSQIIGAAFEMNDLNRYGSLERFQKAFFVAARPSPELEALDAEYNAKLSSSKLTTIEMSQLEREYAEKREALVSAIGYVLVMDHSLFGSRQLTPTLREKVLNDILAIWADDAANRKGALKYQIAVLGRNILPRDELLSQDYIVAADMLRRKIVKIMDNIKEIQELPGARSYRSTSDSLSLGEIASNLDDMLRFRVAPLFNLIYSQGLSKNQEQAIRYIDGQLFDVRIAEKEASSRARALEDSLISYQQEKRRATLSPPVGAVPAGSAAGTKSDSFTPAMIPQFGESFLDRIVDLATRNNDLKFRQDLTEQITAESLRSVALRRELEWYQSMTETFNKRTTRTNVNPGNRDELIKTTRDSIAAILDDLIAQADRIEAIYNELSAHNLNPRTQMYAATEPMFTYSEQAMSLRRMLLYTMIIATVTVFLTAGICLVHYNWRRFQQGGIKVGD